MIAVPYLWLLALFLAPFLIVFKISLSQDVVAQPPYAPQLDLSNGLSGLTDFLSQLSPSLANYRLRAGFLERIPRRLRLQPRSSRPSRRVLLLLVGYPIAYAMARARRAPFSRRC